MAFNTESRRSKAAHRLQNILDIYGITPSALAKAAGLDRSSVCRYVSGIYTPSRKNAEKMAEVLNVDATWLQGKEDPDSIYRLTSNFSMLDEVGKKRMLEYSDTLLNNQRYIYGSKIDL